MSAKTMLVSLNMNGNEVQNFVVHVLATAPAAVEGKMYYNSTDNKLYYYNGENWVDLTSSDDAFGKVKVGSSIIQADSRSDTLEIAAGANVSIDIDTANDKITINAVDTTYDPATHSANGLMSADDKTKLDGIAAGAEVNVNADWNATSGDAQILNKPGNATQSAAGLMSSSDKTKLDGIAAGAEVNVNADWNAASGDAQILNKPTLGAAAAKGVDTSIDSSSTNNDVPTAKATYDFVSEAIAAADAMIFKGTIGKAADNPTITALPTTYRTGWTYRVVTAGTYAGKVCEVGDLIIALVDRSGSGNLDSDWCVAQTNIDGAITSIIAGDGIKVTGSGSSRTIATKLQKGSVTLTAGQTSVSASVTDMVSYKAFDASTGEELMINATQGSSSVSFSINAAYANNITIKYLYYVA